MSDLTENIGANQPELTWRDGGVPEAVRFNDPYFSLEGGLAETRHVFLDGNDISARLRPGFHVAELGFGTGLNLLALAERAQVPIRMTSFEAWPMSLGQLERAHAAFPELAELAAELRSGWGGEIIQVGQVELHLMTGDVREILPSWGGRADAWFLDGFAPAKNPEMWSEEVMLEVAKHTAPEGSFATYTAAGHVRRSLQAAGFTVERRPGFGRKRHMSVGQMGKSDPEARLAAGSSPVI